MSTISKHFTERGARARAYKENTMHRGLSSGWKTFDHVVRWRPGGLRKWHVETRHIQ